MVCRKLFGLVAVCLVVASVAVGQEKESGPLKVLYVTGGGYHDYPEQSKLISEGLSARANIAVTVATVEGGLKADVRHPAYKDKDWAAGYDAVIHNICNCALNADNDYAANVAAAHEAGLPAVVLHCTMHCYRQNSDDTWRRLLGVTSPNHEAHAPLTVTRTANHHPIMQGFPAKWSLPIGELYRIDKLWENTTVLATGRSGDKKDHPVIWTNRFGKAKVFGTTLGHFNEEVDTEEYLGLLTRGLLWACDKLDSRGKPIAGYTVANSDWSCRADYPASEKPVALFNGKDFTGWEGHLGKFWAIEGDMIVGQNNTANAPPVSTYLLTKKHYKDFRLIFETRLAESEMHSGIAIWGKKYSIDGEALSYQGHLVMFPYPYGYYDLYRRNWIVKDDGRGIAAGHQHDWNRVEILAIDNRIQYVVNGKLTMDWKDPKPELCVPGPIGLQLHSNTIPQRVEFRGLVISENPEDRLITVGE